MCELCPSWLSFILYNPVRKALTDRKRVLDESCIGPDSVVLEVGAGNGFFTEAIAERARKVYAVELQHGMVNKLKKRVGRFGEKVHVVHNDIAIHDIGEGEADVCLMYYSFHEVSDRKDASLQIARALKPGGVLAIYEPTVEVNKPAMEKTLKMFVDAGLIIEARLDGLFTRFARLKKYR
ncbi:MAG: class I SAM-dependent methyltransferase [Nitrospirota bacterium]